MQRSWKQWTDQPFDKPWLCTVQKETEEKKRENIESSPNKISHKILKEIQTTDHTKPFTLKYTHQASFGFFFGCREA